MDEYNFIKDSKRGLEAFFARFFDSNDELQIFLSDAFDYENGSLARRQALFQVQRFISLANDIDKIRPGRDPLRILFLKIGLDALCTLSGHTNKTKPLFYSKFCDCFSIEGKNYILNNFRLFPIYRQYSQNANKKAFCFNPPYPQSWGRKGVF